MPEKWERLAEVLASADGWTTASALATRLDVTARTIRSYVARANEGGSTLIESGPDGYRLDRAAWAEHVAQALATPPRAPPPLAWHASSSTSSTRRTGSTCTRQPTRCT